MSPRTFSPFRSQLEEALARFDLPRDSLEIVDSIRDYCAKIGQPELEGSGDRIAKCIISDAGAPKFLLWDRADASDAMLPLIVRKFPEADVRLLNDRASFATHQLLHEVAHFLRRDVHAAMQDEDVEMDCDQWAFDQIRGRTRRTTECG